MRIAAMYWTKLQPEPPARDPNQEEDRHMPIAPFWTSRRPALKRQSPRRPTCSNQRRNKPKQAWKRVHTSHTPGYSFGKPDGGPKRSRTPRSKPHQKARDPRRSKRAAVAPRRREKAQTMQALIDDLEAEQMMSNIAINRQQPPKQVEVEWAPGEWAPLQLDMILREQARQQRQERTARCRPASAPVYGSATYQRQRYRSKVAQEKARAAWEKKNEPRKKEALQIQFRERTQSAFCRNTFDHERPGAEHLKYESTIPSDKPKLRWEMRPLRRLVYTKPPELPPGFALPGNGTFERERMWVAHKGATPFF